MSSIVNRWSPISQAVRRYSLASVGPFGAAAAQFMLTLAMLAVLSPRQFGVFSFFMVVSQFSNLIWGALFGSPLPILVTNPRKKFVLTMYRAMLAACLCLTAVSFWVFLAIGLLLEPESASIGFAVFASLSLLRVFARASAFALGAPLIAVASDLCYVFTLLFGLALLMRHGAATLEAPLLVLSASVLISFVPFMRFGAPRALVAVRLRDLRRYREIWSEHASWSAAGVFAAEMVANAHVYMVTIFLGPLAFAPLSASSLAIRPLNVFMNALSDFDRPGFARSLAVRDMDGALRGVRQFEAALVFAWLGTAALTAIIVLRFPQLLRPSAYDFGYIVKAILIWMAIAGMRTGRVAQSALLQAAGEFRALARITALSSVVSLVSVALLVASEGALLSLLGVFMGETMATLLNRRQLRIWRLEKEREWRTVTEAGGLVQDPRKSMRTPRSRLVIGVKALNEEQNIAAAIESAIEAARPVGGGVVLADCGSSDRTVAIASAYPIQIVQLAEPQDRSCGAGAQLAYQSADCEFFYLLDGDMVIEPAFLPLAIKFLSENPEYAGVGGQLVEANIDGYDFRIRSLKGRERPDRFFYDVDRLDSGGLYRTEAIRDVGYFADKNLHAFEEFDLAARLAARGWRLARLNALSIRHHGHRVNSYGLLWRRWRSGYACGAGEVLRGAIGQPHLTYVVHRLSHLRHCALVTVWWALLALALAIRTAPTMRLGLILLLLLSPVALLALRRRSLRLGVYCLVAWNVSAMGTIAGLVRARRPTAERLAATPLCVDGVNCEK